MGFGWYLGEALGWIVKYDSGQSIFFDRFGTQNNLFLRLHDLNIDEFNDQLKNRYRELRGSYFSYTQLMDRFYNYYNLFKLSGASTREMPRWSIQNMSVEMTFLSNWIKTRLDYLDKQYLGELYSEVKDITFPKIGISPNPVGDILTVSNIKEGDLVQIISLQGLVVAQNLSAENKVEVDASRLVSGVYLVKVGGAIGKMIKK